MSRVIVEYPTSPLTPLTPCSPAVDGSRPPIPRIPSTCANATSSGGAAVLPPAPTHFFYVKVEDVAPTLLNQEQRAAQGEAAARRKRSPFEQEEGSEGAASAGSLPDSAILKICGSYEFVSRAQKSIKVGGRYFFCITGAIPARRPCHLESRLVPGQLLCTERFRKKELMAYAQSGDTSFMISSSEYRNVPNEVAVRRGYWSYSKSLPHTVQFGSWATDRLVKRGRSSFGFGFGPSEEEEERQVPGSVAHDDNNAAPPAPEFSSFLPPPEEQQGQDEEQEKLSLRSIFHPAFHDSSSASCSFQQPQQQQQGGQQQRTFNVGSAFSAWSSTNNVVGVQHTDPAAANGSFGLSENESSNQGSQQRRTPDLEAE